MSKYIKIVDRPNPENAVTDKDKQSPVSPAVESPDFQVAVDKAVAAALPAIAKSVAEKFAAERHDPESIFDRMALAIAAMADQGSGQKRTAPEELEKRAAAGRRMLALIMEAHANGERPEYRVISKSYLADRIINPVREDPVLRTIVPVEIYYGGVPNTGLRPLNAVAKAIYDQFVRSIGGVVVNAGAADTRDYAVTPKGIVVKGSSATMNLRRSVKESVGGPDDPFLYENQATPDPFAADPSNPSHLFLEILKQQDGARKHDPARMVSDLATFEA